MYKALFKNFHFLGIKRYAISINIFLIISSLGAAVAGGILPVSPVPPTVSGMISPPLSGGGTHGHSITELVPPPIHPSSSVVQSSPISPSNISGYASAMGGQSATSSMTAAAALSAAAAAASAQSSNKYKENI